MSDNYIGADYSTEFKILDKLKQLMECKNFKKDFNINDWEINFIKSLFNFKTFTHKQIIKLWDIYEKIK